MAKFYDFPGPNCLVDEATAAFIPSTVLVEKKTLRSKIPKEPVTDSATYFSYKSNDEYAQHSRLVLRVLGADDRYEIYDHPVL